MTEPIAAAEKRREKEKEGAFSQLWYRLLDDTLSQGEAGEIVIEKIESADEETFIEYTVHGYDEHNQAQGIWLEDTDGERYYPKNRPERIHDEERRYRMAFAGKTQVSPSSCRPRIPCRCDFQKR